MFAKWFSRFFRVIHEAVPEFEQAYKDLHSDAMRQEIGTWWPAVILGWFGVGPCHWKNRVLRTSRFLLIGMFDLNDLSNLIDNVLVIQTLGTENALVSKLFKVSVVC